MSLSVNFPSVAPSLNLDFAGSERLDPRITFTRATTARYYDGVTTAKAEENLLVQSQDFNTTWSAGGTTVTANTTAAPDGTTTADTVTATASTAIHRVTQTGAGTSGTTRTFSAFVKAGTHNYIQFYLDIDAQAFANFDVTSGSGVVGTAGSSATSSIVDAGNGWYRCVMTITSANAGTSFNIIFVDASNAARAQSWTTAGTETIILWGAQLEQRSVVTAYTPTTTQPITNYIPVLLTAAAGVARFDHTPTTGTSLGLLVEEQRTNLLTYSAEFDNAAWTKINCTITANTVIAPDGTLTGDKQIINSGTASGSSAIRQAYTKAASAITYTYSVFAKKGEFDSLRFIFRDESDSANNVSVYYNLTTGVVASGPTAAGTFTNPSASIVSVGNGWYRCILTATTGTETSIAARQFIYNDGTTIVTGDGYGGIFIWGAQLEAGAFPTSYIPTGVATATRNADVATMTGTNFSSWYNATEGTFYSESQILYSTGGTIFPGALSANDSTSLNQIMAYYINTNRQNLYVRNSGTVVVDIGPTVTANIMFKFAGAYKENDFAATTNGSAVSTDTSGLLPSGINQLRIGAQATAGTLNGHIRRIAYYPSRLTNEQLVALTR